MELIENLLIIGNGFDSNLNLDTGYKYFLASKEFCKLNSDGNENKLAKYLQEKHNECDWINIEIELKKYSALLNGKDGILLDESETMGTLMEDTLVFKKDYYALCRALIDYLKRMEQKPIDVRLGAYKLIDEIEQYGFFHIITFNYTNTVERLLRLLDFNSEKFNEVITYIHGSLKTDIVFGVEDNFICPEEHMFLYKSYNRFQNASRLSGLLDAAKNIIFYGFSLGETDHPYFDDFFLEQTKNGCKEKVFTFYHYGDKAFEQMQKQLRVLTKGKLTKLGSYNEIFYRDSKND